MEPTIEQQSILDSVKNNTGDIRVNAYAGTGKTYTLKMVVEDNPEKKFLYLAFNKSVAKEAKSKFPDNCFVSTIHGLAYRNVVNNSNRDRFHAKLGSFWKTKDYIRNFEMESLRTQLPPGEDFFVFANDIRNLVNKFKNSDANQITVSMANFGSFRNARYSKGLKETIVAKAAQIWEAECDLESSVPSDHNTYLKMWELSGPELSAYDVVLLDESQDANPVMLSIIEKANDVRKILVGDENQAIYGWNGAVNAMSVVDVEHDFYLTKSWRFGTAIADEGNRILNVLNDNPPPLEGNEDVPSVKGEVDRESQYTVIFRTNGAMAEYAINQIMEEKKVYIEGGVKELCEDLLSLYSIKNSEKYFGKSKYRPYKYFPEVLEESKVDVSIRRDVAFIEKYGHETPRVLELLKKEVLTKRSIKRANALLTTAHKSKGLEFDQVVLWNDFKVMESGDVKNVKYTEREELNLLYVAVTRAKRVLYVDNSYEAFISKISGEE